MLLAAGPITPMLLSLLTSNGSTLALRVHKAIAQCRAGPRLPVVEQDNCLLRSLEGQRIVRGVVQDICRQLCPGQPSRRVKGSHPEPLPEETSGSVPSHIHAQHTPG